jgi:hypothetical protein
MPVFAEFLVGLGVKMRRRNKYAELAMPQSGDEATSLPDTDSVSRGIALGFERELHRDRIRPRTKQVVADRVAATITPGTGHVDPVPVGLTRTPEIRREVLEVVRTIFEVRVHEFEKRLIGRRRLLVLRDRVITVGGATVATAYKSWRQPRLARLPGTRCPADLPPGVA